MSIVAAIREMLAQGVALEDALRVAEAFEAKDDTRSAAAKRQAKYRERKRNETVTSDVTRSATPKRNETVTNRNESVTPVMSLARVEDNLLPVEITGKKKTKPSTVTTRDILLECLKPETADAVLAHRKALRCPLTPRAAELLVKGFNSTADPDGAANEMILRGWKGFKAGWEKDKTSGSGKKSISDIAPSFLRRLDEKFAHLDDVRPPDSGPASGATVRLLPRLGRERS